VLTEAERRQLSDGRDPIIKPWFKNSDIQRYSTGCTNSEWLIHATVDLEPKEHKGVFEHLRSLKAAIESRNYDSGELSKASKLGAWWALSSARKDFDFGTPKIVAPQRSYTNTFGYNEISWYASADVYFITAMQPVMLRPTWAGHEFLDAARNDTIWHKAGERIKKSGVDVTLSLLKEILNQLLKQSLNLP